METTISMGCSLWNLGSIWQHFIGLECKSMYPLMATERFSPDFVRPSLYRESQTLWGWSPGKHQAVTATRPAPTLVVVAQKEWANAPCGQQLHWQAHQNALAVSVWCWHSSSAIATHSVLASGSSSSGQHQLMSASKGQCLCCVPCRKFQGDVSKGAKAGEHTANTLRIYRQNHRKH